MKQQSICSATERPLDALTMEAVLEGRLTTEDFRISTETLRVQADAAEAAGYASLAENFRRAAELACISNEEVLAMYNTLRPGRTTHRELLALAERLERDYAAPLTAALVREAADVYLARGFVKEA